MIKRAVTAAVLGFGVALALLASGGQSIADTEQEELRVLPMGSSTVAGSTPGGFRVDLWQMLVADGWSVDFVGSQSDTSTPIGDPDHEGHGGYRMDHMAAEVVDWVTAAEPDIVLLHAGANDVLQGYQMPTAPDRLGGLIDQILETRPGTRIYVSTVGPVNKPEVQARADAYNAAIPDVVAQRADQGEPVYFVDNTKYIQPSDVRDDPDGDFFHLTHSGNAKMATGWYAALTSTQPTRYEAENPDHTTLNNASVLDTRNASEYRKVGKLDFDDSYLEFSVDVPAGEGGAYRMFVRGGNGTGQPCTHTLTVNDGNERTLSYEPHGWETWTMTGVDVRLAAGANTIRLAHDTCFAEIDSIDLTQPSDPPA